MVFKKMALAVTFSPNVRALLSEVKRLQKIFNSELVLIHAGEQTIETEKELDELIETTGLNRAKCKTVWQKGDAAKVILSVCAQENVDLLVAGAMARESFLKYYIGSVARTIMRESKCSVLLLPNPTTESKAHKKFCVSIDFSSLSEIAAKKAYEFAKLENADEMIFIREFQLPALAITIYDSGSTEEAGKKRLNWYKEEEEKMELFIREMNFAGINLKKVCLYGKQGWETGNYIRENHGDIFVTSSPVKKLKFFNRIFQHDLEFVFRELPCQLLIIKSEEEKS
ncbi:MAG: universal stress protein [Bacteroidota bacterium]